MNYLHSQRSLDDILNLPVYSSGWGPEPGLGLAEFSGTGFAYSHFDKKEKISKIADFSINPNMQHNMHMIKPIKPKHASLLNADFMYVEEKESDPFFTVDSKKAKPRQKSDMSRSKKKPEPFHQGQNGLKKKKKKRLVKIDRAPSIPVSLEWPIVADLDLSKIGHAFDIAKNAKMAEQVKPEDLKWCGFLDHYDEECEKKVSPKIPRPVYLGQKDSKKFISKKVFPADSILFELINDDAGDVYTSDAVLSQLIASPRSVYSWDIVVLKFDLTKMKKANGLLSQDDASPAKVVTIIDRRNSSLIEFMTVSENAQEQPSSTDPEDINYPSMLSQEASDINCVFRQMMCSNNIFDRKMFDPNPFIDTPDDKWNSSKSFLDNTLNRAPFVKKDETKKDEITKLDPKVVYQKNKRFMTENAPDSAKYKKAAKIVEGYEQFMQYIDDEEISKLGSSAFRYRRFNIGTFRLVVRCEVHTKVVKNTPEGEQTLYVNCYSFNEWDSRLSGGVNWRAKMEQKSTIVAKEIQNNSCKVAKWTAQAFLAGADVMKLGFVSRKRADRTDAHEMLVVDSYQTKSFATQISLPSTQIYAIINMYLQMFQKQPPGKYLLFKDPSKSVLKMYAVPLTEFDDEEDSDDEEADNDDADKEEGDKDNADNLDGADEAGEIYADDDEEFEEGEEEFEEDSAVTPTTTSSTTSAAGAAGGGAP